MINYLRHSMFILRFSVIVFVYLTFNINTFAQYPDSPEPWQDAYNISLVGFEFQHPMTVLKTDEIQSIKNKINSNIEPQKSAFDSLVKELQLVLNFIPTPPLTLNIPGGYVDALGLKFARTLLWDNSHAAYTCALGYTFTNDVKYADKAISILMSWTNMETTFTGDDRGLQLGSFFSPMLYAADLLYNYSGWSEADKVKFKIWWKSECVIEGDILRVMRQKDNNWKDAALLGMLAASVVLEDTSYLRESLIQLTSYFYTRTDDNVKLPGQSWKIANDSLGVYLPREVVRNDGRSGLTYTAYALTTMVQAFEIARYAGFDFWNHKTEHGVGIKDVINQHFKWDILNESFPWNSKPEKNIKRHNHYELGNSRVNLDTEIQTFLIKNRPVKRWEGDAYSTLNKGSSIGDGI